MISSVVSTKTKGSMKTFLLYKATLSYNRMKQYLEELTRLGMIEHNPDTGKYYIQERGTKYCSIYKRLSEELNKE